MASSPSHRAYVVVAWRCCGSSCSSHPDRHLVVPRTARRPPAARQRDRLPHRRVQRIAITVVRAALHYDRDQGDTVPEIDIETLGRCPQLKRLRPGIGARPATGLKRTTRRLSAAARPGCCEAMSEFRVFERTASRPPTRRPIAVPPSRGRSGRDVRLCASDTTHSEGCPGIREVPFLPHGDGGDTMSDFRCPLHRAGASTCGGPKCRVSRGLLAIVSTRFT